MVSVHSGQDRQNTNYFASGVEANIIGAGSVWYEGAQKYVSPQTEWQKTNMEAENERDGERKKWKKEENRRRSWVIQMCIEIEFSQPVLILLKFKDKL